MKRREHKTKPDNPYGCNKHKCGLDIIEFMDCPKCYAQEQKRLYYENREMKEFREWLELTMQLPQSAEERLKKIKRMMKIIKLREEDA